LLHCVHCLSLSFVSLHFSRSFYVSPMMSRGPPPSALFPYTTLFRSHPTVAPPAHPGRTAATQVPHARTTNGDRPWPGPVAVVDVDRKSTRLNSSHVSISYAVFCFKKKKL